MGLFDFFNKSNSSKNNDLHVDFKNIDLNKLLTDSFNISEREIAGTDIILSDWETYLDNKVLGAFDSIQITTKGKEKVFSDSDSVQVSFFSKEKTTMLQNQNIVNSVAKICNIKNDNWTATDEMRINSGVWRGRMFQNGESTFYIELHAINGISLTISGFNHFQKKI